MSTQVKIDPEFKALIPPLRDGELSQLEENLVRDGCRDPLVAWKNGHGPVLLDGHNRFEICNRRKIRFEVKSVDLPNRDAAKIWIIENQFGRRNLSVFTRGELSLELEPLYAARAKARQATGGKGVYGGKPLTPNSAEAVRETGETRDAIAKVAGIGHDTIAKVKLIVENASEATKEKLRNNELSVHRVASEIKEKRKKTKRHAARREAEKKSDLHENIIVGDFREHADRIADGSLALIFTDPPYDRKAEEVFDGLADFAARKLATGGSILFYAGHLQLPAIFRAFEGKLRHWWTCACVHSGSTTLMKEYGIRPGWKPMLWFVKETRDDKQKIVSDTVTGQTEKSHHDWQQAESEARHWIEALCPKDGLVCDPFLGGGTTAVAAKKLGRKWIGFEIDPANASQASKRISDQAV